MEVVEPITTNELKKMILNSAEPVIWRNKLKWGLISWSLQDWKKLLKDNKMQFRCGKNVFSKEPQWERTTQNLETSFSEFLEFTRTTSEEWRYFDYKYLREWFTNIPELRKEIKWDDFGFPALSIEDSTIWIGSKGAHTPCHIDTYGCNLIAQVYGRKRWLIFPPEENLRPARIPYEESSIYSKLNFFSPTLQDFEEVSNCRHIVLEPGDVLFLPHRWWHYVENLNTAISVNVWLPLKEDEEGRLEEALIKLFISQTVKDLDEAKRKIILNPNSEQEIEELTLDELTSLVTSCREICLRSKRNKLETIVLRNKPDVKESNKKFELFEKIEKCSPQEFRVFLETQRDRFITESESSFGGSDTKTKEICDIINAFTHPDVISLIKDKLLQQYLCCSYFGFETPALCNTISGRVKSCAQCFCFLYFF